MDDDSCLQLRAVQYHIPNDHIIPLVLRIVFNELGRPEPPQLVHLINSKVLR
nr:unnamed protein product [Callosobruchus chinensis]